MRYPYIDRRLLIIRKEISLLQDLVRKEERNPSIPPEDSPNRNNERLFWFPPTGRWRLKPEFLPDWHPAKHIMEEDFQDYINNELEEIHADVSSLIQLNEGSYAGEAFEYALDGLKKALNGEDTYVDTLQAVQVGYYDSPSELAASVRARFWNLRHLVYEGHETEEPTPPKVRIELPIEDVTPYDFPDQSYLQEHKSLEGYVDIEDIRFDDDPVYVELQKELRSYADSAKSYNRWRKDGLNKPPPDIQKRIDIIQGGMVPSDRDMRLFRGGNFDGAVELNKPITFNTLTSASTGPGIGSHFAERYSDHSKPVYFFDILTPKGTYILPFNDAEVEVLLSMNLRGRVTHIEEVSIPDGVYEGRNYDTPYKGFNMTYVQVVLD